MVGGGPAGAAAAIYAARKGIRTGVVAERFGGQVMDTLGIENFISVKATDGPKFAAALEEHVAIRGRHHQPPAGRGPRAGNWSKPRLDAAAVPSGPDGGRRHRRPLAGDERPRRAGIPRQGVAYCPTATGRSSRASGWR